MLLSVGCENGPRFEGIEEKMPEVISFLLLLNLSSSAVAEWHLCAFTPVTMKELAFPHQGCVTCIERQVCASWGSFLSEQCGFCVSGPKDSFLSDLLTDCCAAAYAVVLRAFFLFVFVELGLAAVSHAGACLRQAENSLSSPKNKSTCLGGTFQHAGCHSFCDKDSRDASSVTEQEKA